MNKVAKVKIKWEPLHLSGRKQFPTSGFACTTEFGSGWKGATGWSIVLKSIVDVDYENMTTFGDLCFLVEDAPHHLLQIGVKLELKAGARTFAVAEIIE